MVIAKIASVELPRMDWPEMIPSLLENMKTQPPISSLKQCTLEAMGYICEEMGQMQDNLLSQDQVRLQPKFLMSACLMQGCLLFQLSSKHNSMFLVLGKLSRRPLCIIMLY